MTKSKVKKWYLVPLILLLTVVPLLVRVHEYKTGFAQFGWYPQSDTQQEFFLYYKALAIIAIAAVMCAVLAYRYMTKKKQFKWSYELIPIAVYAGLTLLSSLFSQYKYFCFHGSSEIFESLWVLLGYCIILFYAYQFINTIEDVNCVMEWLTIGLGIMLVIGVLQAVGHDFFATQLGKILITGVTDKDLLDKVQIIFEKGRVFLTVYNPNYVASYFSLMIPIEIALLVKNKQIGYRILYSVMLVASLVCLLASGNRSGIVAFAVTIVFTIVLLFKYIVKAWKVVIPGVLVAAVIMAAFLSQNSLIIDKFTNLFSAVDRVEDPISEIITGDEDVTIKYLGEEFHIAYDVDANGYITVSIQDKDGAQIANTFDEQAYNYTITDARFPGFTVQVVNLDEQITMYVRADNFDWYFQKRDGSYFYYNAFGQWVKINNAPRVAVNFLEKKFEERGTIWSKTIPMLKNCILFGTGADTYAVTYPQDDYVDKTYDFRTTAVDLKPHCFYLQVATQSGIPALIAVLVLFLWYLVKSFRLYRKALFQDDMEIIGVGLLLATFTYLIISFLNDSTVAVAPIFWIMLGMGISINEIVAKKQAQQLAVSQTKTEPAQQIATSQISAGQSEPAQAVPGQTENAGKQKNKNGKQPSAGKKNQAKQSNTGKKKAKKK